MRRTFHFALLLLLLSMGAAVCDAAEVIDRIVATVDREPILQSDWDEAVAFDALQQGRPVESFSESERKVVLDRMIDQQLLINQMGDSNVVGRPEDKRVSEEVEQIRAQFPGAHDEKVWEAVLNRYGLQGSTIEDKLRRQLQVLGFIDLRLRPEATVQRDEVESYYRTKLIPEVRSRGEQEESLASVYARVEEVVRQQHMNELLSSWLHNLREQSEVQVFLTGTQGPADTTATGGGGC